MVSKIATQNKIEVLKPIRLSQEILKKELSCQKEKSNLIKIFSFLLEGKMDINK